MANPGLIQLSLKNIGQLKGGIVERMLAQQLNRVAMDLIAAPDIAEVRVVNLAIKCKPVIEEGELSDVIVEFAVGTKLPSRVTSARMQARSAANGAKQLFFAVDAPDSPNQTSFLPSAGEDDVSE